MTKKKTSLIQTIVQLVAVVALFIPIAFTSYYGSTWRVAYSIEVSWCDAAWGTIGMTLMLVLALINMVYFILQCTTKLSALRKKWCIIIPCSQLIVSVLNALSITHTTTDYSSGRQFYDFNWGFFLICALYVSIIVLELFKQFSNIEEEKKPVISTDENKSISTSIDEFEKIKQLFDQGLITQEEFDAKKKQLLGL